MWAEGRELSRYVRMKNIGQKWICEDNEKTSHRLRENTCKSISEKGLLSLLKLNNKRTNNPIKKWAKDLNRPLIKRSVQKAKKAYEKMLHFICHQGNASYNNMEISLHT